MSAARDTLRRLRIATPAALAARPRPRRLGRLSAEERIATLVDDGSFVHLLGQTRSRAPWSGPAEDRPEGDGLIAGVGQVLGRTRMIIAHDARFRRGELGERGAQTATFAIRRAIDLGVPLVILSDSDGARVQEGLAGVAANAELLGTIAHASGRIPLACATLGLSGGAAGYGAALCDLNVAVADRSFAFITGPQVIRAVTGEDTTLEAIGGTTMHSEKTGLLHATRSSDIEAIAWVRDALSYLPDNAWSTPPTTCANAPDDPHARGVEDVVPHEPRRGYDVRRAITRMVDEGSVLELGAAHARNIVTALVRFEGRSVGIVASQPMILGGVLDGAASVKLARFVRLCTAFNVPVVTLCDSPGFLPGVKQEQDGLLLHGAKVISAYTEARGSVPLVAVILRKSCGAASVLSYGADMVLALPTARVVAMGTQGILRVAFGTEYEGLAPALLEDQRRAAERLHEDPDAAFHAGYAHRRIEPEHVRREIVAALSLCKPATLAPVGGRKLANLPL